MSIAVLGLLVLLSGVAVVTAVLVARWSSMAAWRTRLVAYQIQPPATLTGEAVSAWLAHIQAMTHPRWPALVPLAPVSVEVVSTRRGISFYVLITQEAAGQLLAGLRAHMLSCRVTEAVGYLATQQHWQVAAELTMTDYDRPLAVERAEQTSTALLAALQPVPGDHTEIRVQYIFTSAGTPRPVPTPQARGNNGLAWALEQTAPQNAEAVQAARAKRRGPLLMATVRLGVSADNTAQAHAL